MPRLQGTFVGLILDILNPDIPLFPLESPYEFIKRKKKKDLERKRYMETLWRMQRQGYLKMLEKNNKKFIQLTSKGEMEKLLRKADVIKQDKWDGKWRVLMFDVPETARLERDRFRWLLKRNNFVKLQASVFISPYPLNREAVQYLKDSGLTAFVRILKVEEMDDDKLLRKRFGV